MLQRDELERLTRYLPHSWEEEQAIHNGYLCGLCGAPICAGIAALHWNCPAKRVTPMQSATRRKRKRAA